MIQRIIFPDVPEEKKTGTHVRKILKHFIGYQAELSWFIMWLFSQL